MTGAYSMVSTSVLLPWGVLGAGGAAQSFTTALARSGAGLVRRVGSRTPRRARQLAQRIGATGGGLAEVVEDKRVRAVYVGLVNSAHAPWVERAIRAGKHVLCEKPLAVGAGQARAMVEAADCVGVLLMEGMSYRYHPQTGRLMSLLRDGRIGDVHHIEASLGYVASAHPESRHLSPALGGGAVLDIGCYVASMVRAVAGAAQGGAPIDPLQVRAHAGYSITGVDDSSAGIFSFTSGVLATGLVSFRVQRPGQVSVYGSRGRVDVAEPWRPSHESTITITPHGIGSAETLTGWGEASALEHEARAFALTLQSGAPPTSGMWGQDSVGNAETLDRWREEARSPKGN